MNREDSVTHLTRVALRVGNGIRQQVVTVVIGVLSLITDQ